MSTLIEDEAAIRALYGDMHRAMVAADTGGLATLLTEDFHLVHMTGYDQPRAEWLAHIDSGRMRYFASREERVTVRVDGDHAQLTGCNQVKADIWGARGTWPLQLDICLIRLGGRWRMSSARASTC
jgi:ketosteroid isomerase-like protein